jgi:hypothetical protein
VSRWAGTRLAVCAFECGEVADKFGDKPALVQSQRCLIEFELMGQPGQTAFSNCPLFINQSVADQAPRLALSGNALSESPLAQQAHIEGKRADFSVICVLPHRRLC